MAEQRILRDTSATIRRTFYVDGSATDADASVTVTIVDAAGDTVVAATAATSEGSGVYSYLLAPQSQLNRLSVSWSGDWSGVTQTLSDADIVEVVGAHLFTEAEARAVHGSLLSSVTKYPDASIAEARDRIADAFEHYCEVSFVPRYRYEQTCGEGSSRLWVKRPRISSVIAASIGGTALTASDVTPDPVNPALTYSGGWTAASSSDPVNVIVEYEHGWVTPPPDIKRAALIMLRHQLIPDEQGGSIPDRALSLTSEFGTMRLSFPDATAGRPYGIPFVDTTLNRYSMRVPVH